MAKDRWGLEGSREVLLFSPQHVKAVPGHKTDICDAEWLVDLLEHGLLYSPNTLAALPPTTFS